MLPWKRTRSQANHRPGESMKSTSVANEPNFCHFTYAGMISSFSNRVLNNHQSYVDICNPPKTTTLLSNPCHLLINSVASKPPGIPNPTKGLKRWDASKHRLSVATSMSGGLGSMLSLEDDDAHKIVNHVVHRGSFVSKDHISSKSSSKIFFENNGKDDRSIQFLNLAMTEEQPFAAISSTVEAKPHSSHLMMSSHTQSYFHLPIDPYNCYLDNMGDLQEDHANGTLTSIFATFPKDADFYPSSVFLNFCHSCKKRLNHNQDIFIYRGDKSFCSEECRDREICFDEIKLKKNKIRLVEEATQERSRMIQSIAKNGLFFLS